MSRTENVELTGLCLMEDGDKILLQNRVNLNLKSPKSRALDSLRDKGYIRRIGSKQEPRWEIRK